MTASATIGAVPGSRMPRPVQMAGWIVRPGAVMRRREATYGDTFRLQIEPGAPWIMVSDPEDVRAVFTLGPEDFSAATDVLRPALGAHSLLCLDGSEHLRQRRLLLPPFHGERMQRYREVMRDATLEAIGRMPAGTPFALRDHTQAITLDVIMRAVFGVTDGPEVQRLRDPLARMLGWFGGPLILLTQVTLGPGNPLSRHSRRMAIDPVDAELRRIIAERRRRDDLQERDDILSLLLLARDEDGAPLTDDELRDELLTLLVAGHETTATGLAWAMERLTRHPAALERLTEEARTGDTTFSDAVVKETLRLRPVVQLVPRRMLRDLELTRCTVPAGEKVVVSIYLVHHRADTYPEPDAFRPERFLADPPSSAYAWIPFGGGIRRCIGAAFAQVEMEVVLHELLSSARFAPVGDAEHAVRRAITLAPERGGQVQIV
jgi:cytochrome P450